MSLTRIGSDPEPCGARSSNGIAELVSAAVANGFNVPRMSSNPRFLLTNRDQAKDRVIEKVLVRGTGLEPARLSPYAPQAYVSANSTTRARVIGSLINYMESRPPAS